MELTNRERARYLPPLSRDPLLTTAAQAHSADMMARDFCAHRAGRRQALGPGRRRVRCRAVGENIACGQRSAAEVVRGWMNSPGENILKPEFAHRRRLRGRRPGGHVLDAVVRRLTRAAAAARARWPS
ncbi:CAP domain-containing protein [Streptomyces thermocarboxydus]